MDNELKKIDPVPKRKVYRAWFSVSILAIALIGLSFFMQSKYPSRFSASATVRVITSKEDVSDPTNSSIQAAIKRCEDYSEVIDNGNFNQNTDKLANMYGNQGGGLSFPAWLKQYSQSQTSDTAYQQALNNWADCIGQTQSCDQLEINLQNSLGFDTSQGVVATDQTRYVKWIENVKTNRGIDYTPTYNKWLKCIESNNTGESATPSNTGTGTPTETGTGSQTGTKDTGTEAKPTGGKTTTEVTQAGGKVVATAISAIASTLSSRNQDLLNDYLARVAKDTVRNYDLDYLQNYAYPKAISRINSLRTVFTSVLSAVNSAKAGDWNGVMVSVFEGLTGFTDYKYAGALVGEPEMSRDTLLAGLNTGLEIAKSTGDTTLLDQLVNGNYGSFGSNGSYSLPSIGDSGNVSWNQAIGSDGSVNNDYRDVLSNDQIAALTNLQAEIIKSGLSDGYLLDSNSDGLPDKLNGTGKCSNLSRCYYFTKVDDEYIYLPAEAILQTASGGTAVSYWVARNFAGTKLYPFLKGPAQSVDNQLGKMGGMIFQNANGNLSLYNLANSIQSMNGSITTNTTTGMTSTTNTMGADQSGVVGNQCSTETCEL